MTEELFRADATLAECDARVTQVDERGVRLDRTGFYPHGGGQAGDRAVGHLPLAAGDQTGGVELVERRVGAGLQQVLQRQRARRRGRLAKSARALLAAGNPPESVAFPSELVYRESLSTRVVSFAIGILLIAGMAWFWRRTGTLAGGHERGGLPVVLWFLAVTVGAWFMLRTRVAFVLGTHRVSARGAVLTASLDYSEIGSIDCTKEVQHGRGGPFPGHRLKFTPKNLLGSAASVFIDEGTLSHDMIARLERLAAVLGMVGHPFEDLRRGHDPRA